MAETIGYKQRTKKELTSIIAMAEATVARYRAHICELEKFIKGREEYITEIKRERDKAIY